MRVLHLTRDFPPRHSGGLSTAVAGLVSAQAAAGMQCVVLSFDNYRPGSRATRKEEASRLTLSCKSRLIRVQEDTNVDSALQLALQSEAAIVHVHQEGLWEFAQHLAAKLEAKSVYSVHVLQSEQDRLRECPPTKSTDMQRQALLGADALHLPSQAAAALLRAAEPALTSKAQVIPLGSMAAERAIPRRNAQEGGGPLVLYVGRFADINGFAQFLQALPQIFAKNPEVHAIAAGGLPGNARGEARWRKRWQTMAGPHASQLSMPGWLDEEELAALYARAALLVVPSWFETFGQVLLEGMLHGTPLVTTGAGALSELVDEDSALLIESKSSDAIAAGVQELLDNPLAAQERARCALRRAREGYLWSERMPAFHALYRKLTN